MAFVRPSPDIRVVSERSQAGETFAQGRRVRLVEADEVDTRRKFLKQIVHRAADTRRRRVVFSLRGGEANDTHDPSSQSLVRKEVEGKV